MSAAGERREAVILTGGRSRRMGSEKALLPLGGGTVIERLALRLAGSFDRIIISVGSEPPSRGLADALARLVSGGVDAEAVRDQRPGSAGPLAGVEAALEAVEGSRAFFVAVDVVDPGDSLPGRLLEEASAEGSLGAVPRCGGLIQGAFAVYTRALLPRVRSLLDAGEARLQALAGIEGVSVVELDSAAGGVFTAFNTPAEFESARLAIEGGPETEM